MPVNHPAVAALPVVGDVNKALLRSLIEARLPFVFVTASEVSDFIAVDPADGTVTLCFVLNGNLYLFDELDTTSPNDGVTCLVTSDGIRYKLADPLRFSGLTFADILGTVNPSQVPALGSVTATSIRINHALMDAAGGNAGRFLTDDATGLSTLYGSALAGGGPVAFISGGVIAGQIVAGAAAWQLGVAGHPGTLALAGNVSGATILQSLATASGLLTLPSATDTLIGKATTDTLTNKTISASSNTISNLTTAMFATNVVDNDATLTANSSTRLATQAAVKGYVDALIAAADAMVFKGVIDCSANPNYPAADRGWTYKVSVAGKIGGVSGINVEVGDTLICITDGTVSGNQATVGANWNIVQANLDGAVTGPASSTGGNIATFNGTGGKVIQDSGKALPSGAIVGTSDSQSLTNKTYNGNSWTAGTGVLTLGAGKTVTVNNTLTFAGTDSASVTFGAGGTVAYQNGNIGAATATSINGAAIDNNAWSTFTPTLTAGSGSLTSATASGRYKQIGKTVHFRITVTITTNGSAAAFLIVGLPVAASATARSITVARCIAVSGLMATSTIDPSATTTNVVTYNNGYPGADGEIVVISGTYEAA